MRRAENIDASKKWQTLNKEKADKYKADFNYRSPLAQRYYMLKYKNGSHISFSRQDFYNWYEKEPQKCFYCDLPVEHIQLHNTYQNRQTKGLLTIDRKDINGGYEFSNMVLSCVLCNFIKSNYFSASDMREIAQKYIKPRWQKEVSLIKRGNEA